MIIKAEHYIQHSLPTCWVPYCAVYCCGLEARVHYETKLALKHAYRMLTMHYIIAMMTERSLSRNPASGMRLKSTKWVQCSKLTLNKACLHERWVKRRFWHI